MIILLIVLHILYSVYSKPQSVKYILSATNIHKRGEEEEKSAACRQKKYTRSQERNCWTSCFSYACKFRSRLQQRLKTRNKNCAYSQPGW
jgi:hypothetical protein